ncbi:MAG: hypothetical protein JRG71_03870 [Deltaproteobacteria bacterium]|nr:hypothetical protein [Deltaproteobacteria bacterium]
MQKCRNFKWIFLLLTVFILSACGGGGGGGSDSASSDTTDNAEVSAIQLTSDSTTVKTSASLTINIALFGTSGQQITEENTVEFSLDTPSLGSIDSSVAVQGGSSVVQFTARDIEGSVILTATTGGAIETLTIQINNQVDVGSISVTANPTQITVGGTSVVSATILDEDDQPVSDGTAVSFSLDNDLLGSVVQNTTTKDSVAKATFSAADDNAGTATISVTSGSVTETTVIEVVGAAAGSIEYDVTATPQVVALKGSGGVETATVRFLVQDSNGNPVIGSQTIKLELSGPNGGEYIGSEPGQQSLEVGTVEGAATTTIHSGTIPGTATITATVLDDNGLPTSLSTSSGVIAIGGGVPSAGHFSLSTSLKNLAGREFDGLTAQITARLADRYGNYNVLEGTAVSFYTESGAIDRATNLNASGEGLVEFRTQTPLPIDVNIVDDDERIWCRAEKENMDTYETIFTVNTNMGNPRDGLCTIIAVVDGEEEFTDANADGQYNVGESFTDTYDDIHLDMDDDRTDIPSSEETTDVPHDTDFEDLIVDRDKNEAFDGLNDEWDSNKRISKPINLLITGKPYIDIAAATIITDGLPITTIAQGGSQTFSFSVHDINYNPLIGGSTISVSADAGTLTGTKSVDIVDTSVPGPKVYKVTLTDDDEDSSASGENATLEVSVDWNGTTYTAIAPILFN